MDDEAWRGAARRAGLEVALRDYPEDVKAASVSAATAAAALVPVIEPAAEPWPAMRMTPAA